MRERANKENNDVEPYSRHRQYSQISKQEYRNQSQFQRQGNGYPIIEKYEPRKRDFADQLELKHGIKYYGKDQKRQVERYEMGDKVAKFGGYEAHDKYNHDTFADHSFGESSLQSEANNPQQRRENAKRKGLDIKMSNINCINDKINSLLSMVKKEKNECYSKDDNNSPQRTQSPVIQRIGVQYQQPSDQKGTIRNGTKISENDYRAGLRMKTYSAIESKSSSKKILKEDSGKGSKQYNNDQDRYEVYNPSNYHSPSKNQREEAAHAYNYEKYEKSPYTAQRNERASKYPPIQRSREQLLQGSDLQRISVSGKKTQKTPTKYQPTYKESSANRANSNIAQRSHRTPTLNLNLDPRYINTQSTFMPITLLQKQSQENYQEMRQNLSGIRMIDDKLKRIKEKVSLSQNQNRKYQQRLMEDKDIKQAHAGKIYTNDSSSKKFQLKLHPVVNDKAETVRIAEKLCYQIEVDSRMRKVRDEFCDHQGQQKWKDLEVKLAKNGVRVTVLELKEMLTPSPDEFSPFGEDSATQSTDLLRAFTEAQKHWEKQVSGCANMKVLRTEGFTVSQLDLNRKGHLSIEDLVCFVNLYTGHFYKNRDLAIIYRRLLLLERGKSQSGVDYSTFLRAFTL